MLKLPTIIAKYRQGYIDNNYRPNEIYFARVGYEDGIKDTLKILKERGFLKDGVDIDIENL